MVHTMMGRMTASEGECVDGLPTHSVAATHHVFPPHFWPPFPPPPPAGRLFTPPNTHPSNLQLHCQISTLPTNTYPADLHSRFNAPINIPPFAPTLTLPDSTHLLQTGPPLRPCTKTADSNTQP